MDRTLKLPPRLVIVAFIDQERVAEGKVGLGQGFVEFECPPGRRLCFGIAFLRGELSIGAAPRSE